MRPNVFVVLYVLANAAANLVLNATPFYWRPLASTGIAFFFVAFDITSRDRLHDTWRGDWRKLAILVGAGALVSLLVNAAVWPIALASCLAFALAGAGDTATYHLLRSHPWLWRANGSNVVSAIVDSATFLTVAATLGVFPWPLVPLTFAVQVVAKTLGGLLWSYVLRGQKAFAL